MANEPNECDTTKNSNVRDSQPSTAPPVLPGNVLRLLQLGTELNSSELMINILDERESLRLSLAMQGTSIGKRLGLFVLDGANDSNPYCYIAQGVAQVMVVHFNHDPEPKIEFETLAAFEVFLRKLRAEKKELGKVSTPSPAHPKKTTLAAALSELAHSEDEDSEFLTCLYIPLLRGNHSQLIADLAEHKSFFVREAVVEIIGTALLQGSDSVLQRLASDPHPQVRRAALRTSGTLRNRPSDA